MSVAVKKIKEMGFCRIRKGEKMDGDGMRDWWKCARLDEKRSALKRILMREKRGLGSV